MKRGAVIGMFAVFLAAACLSVFFGSHISDQKNITNRESMVQTQLSFAVSKVNDLKNGYDADTMEALISNVYAACQFTDDSDLETALYDLWNALVFEGESISGNEDELIKALQSADSIEIDWVAYNIRGLQIVNSDENNA